MARLNPISEFSEDNLNYLLDTLINETKFLLNKYLTDTEAIKIFSWYNNKLILIKKLMNKEAKLELLELHQIMIKSYKSDPSCGGFHITYNIEGRIDRPLIKIDRTFKKK
ncbi:hypothetical protein DFQ09_10321 [Winogradskyella pacifica]|uniref:Uncharacterized protein n=1 Tax=Winogradskyella pacifica TaxID=664642 RepID=A0A3D9MZD6_9FLAO|nr:hypothetical protein [Winogradskyella pacifica]REE24717.1 hypothetical protein DFQ09_10321 [Winogradskyella pacifica]